jgi:N-sulfoglucosamine sulfohydrolase
MVKNSLVVMVSLVVAAIGHAAEKNVVLLIADDLGNQLGCYGDAVAKTPHIDALAAKGTRFTHGFASVASCSPSRATMLTGQPGHQNGQYGLAHADHNFHSFTKVKSLPGILNAAGYHTAVLAKQHVQPTENYPFTQVIPAGGGRNGEAVAAAAKKVIDDAKEAKKPFFLHVGYTDPHRAAKGFANDGKLPASIPAIKFDPKTIPVPRHLPDAPDCRQDLAEYYQSVARLDHNVGLMMKTLADSGVINDTLIVFLSDNGIPFAGAKTTLYDAGVRLPFIVVKPGQKAGVVNDMMMSWTDLAPTVLDWAGLSKPDTMLGQSVLSHLEQAPREGFREVYCSHTFHEVTMYYPMRSVRTSRYKLILNLANGIEFPHAGDLWASPTWQGVLTRKDTMLGQRSMEQYLHRPKVELYDLEKDADEVKNVAESADYATVRKELSAKLALWRKKTNDPWLVKDLHE